MDNFMYADLSRMMLYPKCAVILRTEEEARAFFYNAIQQLAEEYMHWDIDDVLSLWNIYKEKTGFTLFASDYDEPESISYCDENWFRETGYEIVEFCELSNLTEIEESEMPIESILGAILG